MELKNKKKPQPKLENALFAEMKRVGRDLIKADLQPLAEEFEKVFRANFWDLLA